MWLASLAKHLTTGQVLPADLLSDIENFKDFSEKQSSPTTAKKLDAKAIQSPPIDALSVSPSSNKSDLAKRKYDNETDPAADGSKRAPNGLSCSIKDLECLASKSIEPVHSSFREIPKSPHLSKDFSPNGERLRNSIRARRQERLAKQRSMRTFTPFTSQLSTCSSDAGSETSCANLDDAEDFGSAAARPFGRVNELKSSTLGQRRRSKPYGDKGFIINVNDGLLTINDVKDLNNCFSDDLDSSCDTSLNYIDCNASIPSSDSPTNANNSLKSVLNGKLPENVREEPDDGEDVNKVCKETLESLREEMNKCKSRLEALKIAGNGATISLRDMSAPKKKAEARDDATAVLAASPVRLTALSPPVFSSRTTGNAAKPDTSYLPKKHPPKRIASSTASAPKTNKCNNRNSPNNSAILADRAAVGNSETIKPIKTTEAAINSPKKPNDFILEKYNKMNNRVHSNDTSASDQLVRKPPTIASAKKRDGNKNGLKANDKVPALKKASSIISSSTRKFL